MAKSLRTVIKNSNSPLARAARGVVRALREFTLPAPWVVFRPILWGYVAVRAVYGFAKRVLVCEPLFKAYCKSYGRRVRTGDFIHWFQGQGDLIVGDDVLIDGKCGFSFATFAEERPTLVIGDRTVVGHLCGFTVGRRIEIGRDCMIAAGCWMFDFPGHPLDPDARRAGLPPRPEDVRPVRVGDNVWIGRGCVVMPGVTIGEGSVVAVGSVVTTDVPPYTVVAGYPARKIGSTRTPVPAPPTGDVARTAR